MHGLQDAMMGGTEINDKTIFATKMKFVPQKYFGSATKGAADISSAVQLCLHSCEGAKLGGPSGTMTGSE